MSPSIALVGIWSIVFGLWFWKVLHRGAVARGDLSMQTWRRCDQCGKRLVRVTTGGDLQPHIGHSLRPAHDGIGPVEYFQIITGAL